MIALKNALFDAVLTLHVGGQTTCGGQESTVNVFNFGGTSCLSHVAVGESIVQVELCFSPGKDLDKDFFAAPYPLAISGALGWREIAEGSNAGNPVVCGGVVTSELHQSVVESCYMLNFRNGSYEWTEAEPLPWPLAHSGIAFHERFKEILIGEPFFPRLRL